MGNQRGLCPCAARGSVGALAVTSRPHLAGLTPAIHGALSDRERREAGLDGRRVLDFSVNTNPFGPPSGVLEAFRKVDVTRYPDPEGQGLRDVIAQRHGVAMESVVPGNGSVELIWLVASAYLEPGRWAAILGPTFGEYEAAARAAGARVALVRAEENRGFLPDPVVFQRALVRTKASVAFVCNPNNPTGVVLDPGLVRRWAQDYPNTLFVVDEAYLPFVRHGRSCLAGGPLENLLVLRSLTKDCAIPGLRLGYAVGHREVTRTLKTVQPPWSVNAAAQAAGVAALTYPGQSRLWEEELAQAKAYLTSSLRDLGLEVLPSETNFVLVRTGDGAGFRAGLLQEGCCVRDCASFGLPEYVRIGVRTLPECRELVAAVGRVMGRGKPSHDRQGGDRPSISQQADTAKDERAYPLAYLITFTCYGAHLHGDASGSVARALNLAGTPYLDADPIKLRASRTHLTAKPYEMDVSRRRLVLDAIRETCRHRRWSLLAVHVRSTHVHVVVHGMNAPERLMNDFKAYASRALSLAGWDSRDVRRWTRHGSTRYLWRPEQVEAAIQYTVHEQGEPMAVYENLDRRIHDA